MLSKFISSFKASILCAKFVWFHAVESKIELTYEFWEKWSSSAPYWVICTQIALLLFLLIYILHIKFCANSSTRNRGQRIPQICKKCNYSAASWAIFTKSSYNWTYVRITLNTKFHEIPCISSRATLSTKFLSHTDRQTFSRNSQIVIRISQNV